MESDLHVLVVDDELVTRNIVCRMLEQCGYRVSKAANGREAIEVLCSKISLPNNHPDHIDTILTDLMMPEVSGYQILRFVQSHDSLHNIPVVLMSSKDDQKAVLDCIENGAEDYILKPISKKDVINLWQHAWRRRKSDV